MADISSMTGIALGLAALIVQPIHLRRFGKITRGVSLAVIDAPLLIVRIIPASFEFFACHNISLLTSNENKLSHRWREQA
jgi:hypothetical protein